jgi:hypothetical protein
MVNTADILVRIEFQKRDASFFGCWMKQGEGDVWMRREFHS